jgi:MFS family permease
MITPIALWLVTFGTGVPFIGGALACFAAALSMRTSMRAERDKPSAAPSRIQRLVTRISLSLLTNFIAGFMEGSLIALIPLYTLREGFTASQTGMLLSAFMIGHGGAPPFIGMLADRIGLRRVLAIVYMLGFAVFMIMVTGTFRMGLAVPLLLAGMSVGALYPLAVGIIGERLSPEDLPRGNAMITACYGMGSIVGPFLPAIIMHVTMPRSLFVISAFLYMVVLIIMIFQSDLKSANGR